MTLRGCVVIVRPAARLRFAIYAVKQGRARNEAMHVCPLHSCPMLCLHVSLTWLNMGSMLLHQLLHFIKPP